MAFAFKFGPDVTRLIESMRDWKLEDVKRRGGTPSRLALSSYWTGDYDDPSAPEIGGFKIVFDPPHPVFTCEVIQNEYVIIQSWREMSWVSPYPNLCVDERMCAWSYEERMVIDLRAFHGWGPDEEVEHRILNPPSSTYTREMRCPRARPLVPPARP